jgi:ribonuclease P/MRP protein subunit RPP1
MISETNIEKTKKAIKNSKVPIVVEAQDDNYNRKLLEYGKFDVLLSPESGSRRNTIRQIDSGLNHVLAKIATKNSVAIGIDIESISKLSKPEKAKRLAKIAQNIKICRKAKTKLAIINPVDKKDSMSLLSSLGASTQQTKQAISF